MNTDNLLQHKPYQALLRFLDISKLVFAILFFVVLLSMLPTDPDYYWHLMTGKHIFEQHTLPSSDIFSYTQHGKPWVLHEWLFQLTLYVVYASAGQLGVDIFTSLLGILALYFIYSTARHITANSTVASYVAIVFVIFLVPAISPRPQIFSFILFAVFLSILLRHKYLNNHKYLFAMPFLMVVWVNAHGGYLSGIALLLIFTLCEWLSHCSRPAANKQNRKNLNRLTIITVITALASSVNPEFIGHWFYPFNVLNMEVTKTIVEWQSPDFSKPIFKAYLLLSFGYYVLLIYGKERPDLSEVIIPGFFILSSFVSVRHMPLAILTLIPFVSFKIYRGLDESLAFPPIIENLQRMYKRRVGHSKQLGDLEYIFNWILLVFVCLVFAAYYPVHHARDKEKLNAVLPLDATEFLINNRIHGRIFHTYHYGGYLLYRLYPKQKVFIDGRADMYGDEFIRQYRHIETGKPGWEKLFNRYNIDYIVCDRNTPIRQLLFARGDFVLIYDDETSSVLVKNSPKYADVISKYGQ